MPSLIVWRLQIEGDVLQVPNLPRVRGRWGDSISSSEYQNQVIKIFYLAQCLRMISLSSSAPEIS